MDESVSTLQHDTLIVYRLEHSGCEWGQPHHGPFFKDPSIHVGDSIFDWEAPSFGGNGPTPWRDSMRFHERMICAVLREQVESWWGVSLIPPKPKDWSFGVYEVARRHLSFGKRQVAFEPKHSRFAGWFPGWADRSGSLDDRYPDEMFRSDEPWPLFSEQIVLEVNSLRQSSWLSGSSA